MTSSIGRLIQPYVQVKWGDTDLTAYQKDSAIPIQPIVHNVRVSLSQEEAAGKLEFEFSESPLGFEALVDLKTNSPDKPITVTIGYEKGSFFSTFYQFAGLRFSTGHDMKASVTAVGLPKGAWTDNKISYTMEKEIPLDQFPDFLKKKCGDGCKAIKFKFVGQLAEDAKSKIKIKRNDIARTPHTIISDVMRAQGATVSVSDSVIDGSLVFHYPLTLEKESEAGNDQPAVAAGQIEAVVGERKVFIIGPGLLNSFSRDQTFNLGQTTLRMGSSTQSSPASIQQVNKEVAQEGSAPQQEAANSTNSQGGTGGIANPGQARSGTTTFSDKEKKALAAKAAKVTTKCSAEFFMVPYLVGIKPRDIVALPSLKVKGDDIFVEDWLVDSVNYSQDDNGVITVQIDGSRPYTGDVNIVDEKTLKAIQDTVKPLLFTGAWHEFYWNFEQAEAQTANTQSTPGASAPKQNIETADLKPEG